MAHSTTSMRLPRASRNHPGRQHPPARLLVLRSLHTVARHLREHLRGEEGYTTETVIVTALLAAAALAVIAILVAKITGFANGIQL